MNIASFEFNIFGVNTYIVWDENTKKAAVVDPGMCTTDEEAIIADFIENHRLNITHLINTHLHIDHTLGNDYISNRYSVTTEANPGDTQLGLSRGIQAEMFRLRIPRPTPLAIEHELHDGDILHIGSGTLEVITVPGHTQGSIALYCPESKFVITGDALFERSIGRTDLPGGDYISLINSIRTRLLTLPPDTMVYPGHGGRTTIDNEIRHNPYLH